MIQERNTQRRGGRRTVQNAISRHGLIVSFFAVLLFGCVGETGPDRVVGDDWPTDRWTVTNFSGSQSSWREGVGDWRSLSIGTTLIADAEIRTGAASAAVLARGGDTITLAENSQMALPPAPTASGFTRIMQSVGTLFFQVEKRPTPHFEVTTPYLVATVKGTTFSVSVAPASATVSVQDGVVGVADTAGGPSIDVTAGLSATAAPGAGMSVSPAAAPAAPSIAPDARSAPGSQGRGQAPGQAQSQGRGQSQGQGQGQGNSGSSNSGGNSDGGSGNSGGGNSDGGSGNSGGGNSGGNSDGGSGNSGGNSGGGNSGGNSGNAGGNSGNNGANK